MESEDFTAELAQRLGYSVKEAEEIMATMIGGMVQQLQEGNRVAVPGLGVFGVKKHDEHVSVNSQTGQRFLVPPQLVVDLEPDMAATDEHLETE
jgi:nucleoid DNA-binding protein